MNQTDFSLQHLPERAVIALSGEGVLAWLHNLLTCDVADLAADQAAYGALLTPQGKILHDMFVFHAGDRILLDCAASQRAALIQKLTLYRLRAKISVAADDSLKVGVSSSRIDRPMAFADPRLAAMGWRVLAAEASLPAGSGYHAARIRTGLADSDQDIGVEKLFPHEANLDQFKGVNFTKGCYVGQEVVSRMQHRGTARNRILPVNFDGAISDRQVTAGEKPVGELLSILDGQGLALLRIDRLAEATAPLLAGETHVSVVKPNWISYEVAA